jgi:hypothetical protein
MVELKIAERRTTGEKLLLLLVEESSQVLGLLDTSLWLTATDDSFHPQEDREQLVPILEREVLFHSMASRL